MSNKPSTIYPNGVKPQAGDTARSCDVGRGTRAIRIWEACPSCGKERWIKRNTSGTLCSSCARRRQSLGSRNSHWNIYRRLVTKNVAYVYIAPDHPFFCMVRRASRVLEHRLVMAEHIGRSLKVGEVVHHIDGNRLNNNINNLMLLPSPAHHSSYTQLQQQVRKLEEELGQVRVRLVQLEVDNARLEALVDGQGNPDLAEDVLSSSGKSRDFTLPAPEWGKEKVHPSRKLEEKGA